MRFGITVFIVLFFANCTSNDVEAKFAEFNNDLAHFNIKNNTQKNIDKIEFLISFYDASNTLIHQDTTSFIMQNSTSPFLKAKKETFIIQKSPEGCHRAAIEILEVSYSE